MRKDSQPFEPTDEAVRELIALADAHPLGRKFLLTGALDAVAATFSAHAFTVDRARETLASAANTPAAKTRAAGSPSAR